MNRIMTRHYQQLLGRRIVQIVESTECPPTPGLLMDNGKIAWIQCDPEGNGPGFLQIEEVGRNGAFVQDTSSHRKEGSNDAEQAHTDSVRGIS